MWVAPQDATLVPDDVVIVQGVESIRQGESASGQAWGNMHIPMRLSTPETVGER